MLEGILGKKLGMSQVFDEKNNIVPVTLVQAGPCTVLAQKTKEKDGYESVQLGFENIHERLLNKPLGEYLKKVNAKPLRFIREICGTIEQSPGNTVTVEIFKEGDFVDITGTSKGKGFAGGMKRHGWSGGPASHGSMSHRRVGSIGNRATPGRVFKGKTMPGRMGHERVTVQNLKVVKVDKDKNLLVVRGAVAGFNGSYLIIRKAIKKKAGK